MSSMALAIRTADPTLNFAWASMHISKSGRASRTAPHLACTSLIVLSVACRGRL